MTRLYECDHCGAHVKAVAQKLYVQVSQISTAGSDYSEAYHVCKTCWDELDWD